MTISPPYLKDADGNTLYFPSKFYVRSESISRRSSLVQLPYSDLSRDTSDGCFNPRRIDVSGILYADDEETARALLDSIHAFSYRKGLELWFKGRRIKIDKLLESTIQDSGKRGFLYNVNFGFQASDPFWYSEEKILSKDMSQSGSKPIYINNTASKNIINAYVCIRINEDSDIGAKCRSDGYDVRFVDDDGRELSQCRLSFSVSSGKATGEFWVLIPNLPASGKTIYCVFGNPSATDVSNSTINPDVLMDGDFEQWTSSTNLANWTENVTGSSTVNQESTEKTRGNYSTRFDVDANGSNVYISQNFISQLVQEKKYKICLKAKSNMSGKSAYINLTAYDGSNYWYWDFVQKTWAQTWGYLKISLTTSWQKFSDYFSGPFPIGIATLSFLLGRNYAISSSLYFDDVKIFKADSYDACDMAEESWYNQSNVISWGAEESNWFFPINGTAETYPKLKITMPAAASSLLISLNSRECQMNLNFSPNDILEIDSYLGTVQLNGQDKIAFFQGFFPKLKPGTNILELSRPAMVEIHYSEAYV